MPDIIQIAIQATDNASKVIGGVGDSLEKLDTQTVNADKKLKLFGATSEQIAGKMNQIGKAATIGVTLPLVGIGIAATKAASDLNETTNKIDTIFGEASDSVKKFASTASTSLGQSKKQALDAAADFGVFGKAAGLAGEDLADFSKQNVQLAADFASFFNTSPQEAITAIGAAFRGESEPIRRYGVLINEASLKDEALRAGLIKTTNEALTPQARVLAAQALILKQTTAAQGDFAKTSEGLANQSRILEAQFQDLLSTLGQNLLPVAVKLAGVANDLLKAFQNLTPEQQNLVIGFGAIAAAAGPVLTVSSKLIGVFGTIKGAVTALGASAAPLAAVVAGLAAIVTYLDRVGQAARKSTEDLIAMSKSGDLFDQAAATTEILTHGQDRLKAALDGVNAQLKTSAKGYADYKSSIEATAKAAGYEINAAGDLVKVYYGVGGRVEKVIEANYALTDAQYKLSEAQRKATEGAYGQSGALDETNRAMRDITGSTTDWSNKLSAVQAVTVFDASDRAARRAAEGIKFLSVQQEKLKVGIGGALQKETKNFTDRQTELQQRLKETGDELKKLEEEQGKVDKTTVKNAMSANELTLAHARLADMQARLAKETDPAKQAELAAQIGVAREKIEGANQSTSTYIDNQEKIKNLRGTYDQVNKEIAENAKAHEEAAGRIIYSYAETLLAQDGYTDKELEALAKLGNKLGIYSDQDVKAFEAIRKAAGDLAKDDNTSKFAYNVVRAADETQNAAGRIVSSLYPVGSKIDETALKALGLMNTLGVMSQQTYYVNLQERFTPAANVAIRPDLRPSRFQHGADFIVPPGYSNDSYPMRVSSGEHVQVTPQGERGSGAITMGDININVGGSNATPEEIKRAVYSGIVEVFNGAMQ